MKKIFSLLITFITVFLIVFGFSKTHVHAESSEETSDDGYILPVFGEDEPIYSGDEALSDKDDYEKNDSFKKATDISVHSADQPDDDTQSINATIHKVNFFASIWRKADQDYYRLDVFGDAYITITLSVPSNVNYNIDLWKHTDSPNSGWSNTHILPMKSGTDGGVGANDKIIINDSSPEILTAGTYYIRVFSYNEIYNSGNEYTLTYDLDYCPQEIQYVSQMRFDKGAKAAIWKSDFNPYGYNSYNLGGELDVSSSKVPIHNTINSYATSYGVVNSVLYVWDVEWRYDMYLYLNEIIPLLENVNNKNQRVRVILEETENGAELLGLGLNIVGLLTEQPIVSGIGEIISLSTNIGVTLTKLLFPDIWETTLQDAINYLIMLRNVLHCDRTMVDSTEVIAIRCKYKYNNGSISFMPTINSSEIFIHESDSIPAYNYESHTYGKTYPLISPIDFYNVVENCCLEDKPDINTCSNIEEMSLDEIQTGNLIPGKYYWYKFIAPSTGTYNFYSSSDIDTYGELFSAVDPARKTDHRLANGYNDDSGEGSNFSISYQLTENQVVYLRVRGYNWAGSGTFAVTIDKAHIHSYTYSYEQDSSTKHKAYCSCGSYISEDHTFVNGTCSKCVETETTTHTHNFIYTSCGDGATHRKRCLCGYVSTEPCMGLYEPGNGTVCTKCGQNMSNGGALLNGSTGDENIVLYHDEEDNLV